MSTMAGPLAGVSVLELGTMYAAPTCGRMLRDFGARVIKVEDPGAGDYARHWTPQKNGLSLGFARLNAGKQSVGIDLRQPAGRDLVRRLASTVDIVVESFRPGRLEGWGLGYEVLAADNPGLILTRVSGFGQTGPYREQPGFGTVAETSSGYAFINGWPDTPPTSPPFGFADSIAGISAAMGTAMALYRRESHRRGRRRRRGAVRASDVHHGRRDPALLHAGRDPGARRQWHWVRLAARHLPGSGRRLAVHRRVERGHCPAALPRDGTPGAVGRSAIRYERGTDGEQRRHPAGGQRLGRRPLPGRDAEDPGRVRGGLGTVNDARDIVADPHFLERTLVELTGSQALGQAIMPGPVLHMASAPAPVYDGVPAIGEHTASVLAGALELTPAQLAELAGRGVIGPV